MVNVIKIGLGALLLVGVSAQAGVTINSTRVGAVDVAALEKFYEAAFGMQECSASGPPRSC